MGLLAGVGDFGIEELKNLAVSSKVIAVSKAAEALTSAQLAAQKAAAAVTSAEMAESIAASVGDKLQVITSINDLKAYTSYDFAHFSGSTWERKSGNKQSNGGTLAGTVISASSSFYWERKTQNSTLNADDFETIKLAVDALPDDGGTIVLGKKEYLSPYLTNATRLTKSNVNFIGQGNPIYNATFTKLINGTIIKGAFIATADNLSFENLGIDSGSDFVGSTAQEGLVIKSLNSFEGDPLSKNIRVENCTFLVKAYNSAVHSLYFEGVTGGYINNVCTCFGGSGIVVKGSNNIVTNVSCKSHAQYALLFKSDIYAVTNNCIATNVKVSKASVSATGDLIRGIYVQAAGADCKKIDFSNIIIKDCDAPITIQGISPFFCKNIAVTDAIIENTTGSAIETIRCEDVVLDGIKSNISLYGATITDTSTNVELSYSNFLNCSSSGINQSGINTKISNCVTNAAGRGVFFIAGTASVANQTDYSSVKYDIYTSTYNVKFTGGVESVDATMALKIIPTNGQVLYINSTSGLFTTAGFWLYENSTWIKANAVANIIGADELISSTRLSLLGFSDTVPLQKWGNGSVISTGIFRTSSNVMKMVTSNYGGNLFLFEGKYAFQENLAINRNIATEKLDVNGAIKIANPYSSISANASTPVPAGGPGTIVCDAGHYYGWNGLAWKQLDN
jgi:hypothetical protein